MNPSTPMIAPSVRPRRWWLRGLLLLLAFMILAPLLTIGSMMLSARNAWDAAEEEATRLDPRWKLMEIEADRMQIADAENSALFMNALRRKRGGFRGVGAVPNYDKIFEKLPPNVQLNGQQLQVIRGELAKIAGPLQEARKLKDMPNGRIPVTYSDDWISTLLPEHQEARTFADWLQHDAFDLAEDGKYDEALESCQALLSASGVFKEETFLISLLIRVALQSISVTAMERVLAQGEPSDETLQATQARLAKEINSSGWLQAIRGERAGAQFLFENIRSGKVTSTFRSINGARALDGVADWFVDTFPSAMVNYYPEYLRHMTRCVEIAKLPIQERGPRTKAWNDDTDKSKNPVIRILAPALANCHRAECRSQAWLRSAMVAMACERYRQKHERWPATLDLLVKEKLLDAVPLDPIHGQPLRYLKTNYGVVIYSIGIDGIDNQGNIDHDRVHQPGFDVGFRLWDLGLRRMPPLPPVALPEGK
jgi:hypothetical protein